MRREETGNSSPRRVTRLGAIHRGTKFLTNVSAKGDNTYLDKILKESATERLGENGLYLLVHEREVCPPVLVIPQSLRPLWPQQKA